MLVKGEPIESENVRFYAIEEDRLAMYTRKGQGQIINILMDMDSGALADSPSKGLMIQDLLKHGVGSSDSLFEDAYYDGYIYDYYNILRYILRKIAALWSDGDYLRHLYHSMRAYPVLHPQEKRQARLDVVWCSGTFGIVSAGAVCLRIRHQIFKAIINSISEIEYNDGEDYLSVDTKMAVFNNKRGTCPFSGIPMIISQSPDTLTGILMA